MKNPKYAKSVCKRFGLDHVLPILLFAPSPLDEHGYFGNGAIKLAREWATSTLLGLGEQLIIKLHPSATKEDYDFYDMAMKSQRAHWNTRIIMKHDPLALVAASDIVVSHHSTMAVDAYALGKPSIAIFDEVSDATEELSEFLSYKSISTARNPQELMAHIQYNTYKEP